MSGVNLATMFFPCQIVLVISIKVEKINQRTQNGSRTFQTNVHQLCKQVVLALHSNLDFMFTSSHHYSHNINNNNNNSVAFL